MGTLGRHLAHRLVEIGVEAVFGVPGDFNLLLLDEMVAEPRLRYIGCCNELNAGYAADGYARAKHVGACVVTFTVGSLSVINAIAGAYSENLPVICIVGGPNSNDYGSNRILHHTIGHPDFGQELRCFQQVTCTQVVVKDLENGQEMIDYAISSALKESKPVYISISCNIPAIHHPGFARAPVPYAIASRLSNPQSLEAAAEEAAKFLNTRTSPVLVAGPKLRLAAGAEDEFLELANQSDYAVAVMPSAKGQFSESHPHFIGTYWGPVSSSGCVQTVDEADGVVFVGPVFNDYSLIEYGSSAFKERAIVVQPDRVVICSGLTFGCVLMKDFLRLLSTKVQKNNHPFQKFERLRASARQPEPEAAPGPNLTVRVLYQHVQNMLTKDSTVITDNGDSWFNTQNLKLPDGCGYEIQLQYGSIGWSVGASLGYAEAAKDKRVIAFIGDGSFQVTAQDVSTMLRCKQRSIIFLLNNGGYTIEVLMHDGPYNVIKNWNYTKVVESFHNGEGRLWTAKATTEAELVQAIEVAQRDRKDDLCFIECFLDRRDASKELPVWGSRVSASNLRPPNPQ